MNQDNRFYDLDKVFDNHSLYNQYQVFGGGRQLDPVNTPSVTITAMKLKKALKELNHQDIEEAIDDELESEIASERIKKDLIDKIDYDLHNWQLFQALDILLGLGRIEAIAYVFKCKKMDEPEN